jgi:mannosyl-3-phosphoglycerate phosphatase
VTPALCVATDLDGTLLDASTYSWEAAREALEALRERGVPLALCSSKTRAEMEAIAGELGITGPLVVENGGALILPEDAGARVHVLGVPRSELVQALRAMAAEAGASVQGFAELSGAEIGRLTGLSPEAAARAARREYDEPFSLEEPGALPRLEAAAVRRGLQVTRGGRFFHLTGPVDKGEALRLWLATWEHGRRPRTVGLGDAPNDATLLRVVDRAILIPQPDGQVDATLAAAFPSSEIAPAPGPVGWNTAVLAVLEGRRLPQA